MCRDSSTHRNNVCQLIASPLDTKRKSPIVEMSHNATLPALHHWASVEGRHLVDSVLAFMRSKWAPPVERKTFEGENFHKLVKNTIFVEKTFMDCSLLPYQRTPCPKSSRRKLSRLTTKPQNSWKFSPSKVSRYVVGSSSVGSLISTWQWVCCVSWW